MAYSESSVRNTLESVVVENSSFDPHLDLEKETCDFLSFIFNELKECFVDPKIPHKVHRGIPENHEFEDGDSHLYPREIQDYIKRMDTLTYRYNFKIGERHITADLAYFKDEPYIMKPNEIIKYIYCWLSMATKNISPSCSRKLHIQLILTNFKKQMLDHTDTDDISANNVNSAFTTSCSEETSIVIYRSEEWFKVFIHETFHCLGLDFSHVRHDCSSKLNEHFHFRGVDYKVFESYCETWARIINVCFSSYNSLPEMTSSHKKFSTEYLEFTSLFSYYMTYEMLFSALQLNKVLGHQEIDISVFSKNTPKSSSVSLYKENTAVVSYYIFSGILVCNFQSFIHWCTSHHKKGKSLFQFHDTKESIVLYCDLIVNLSKKHKFRQMISYIKDRTQHLYLMYPSTMMMSYIPLPLYDTSEIKIIV